MDHLRHRKPLHHSPLDYKAWPILPQDDPYPLTEKEAHRPVQPKATAVAGRVLYRQRVEAAVPGEPLSIFLVFLPWELISKALLAKFLNTGHYFRICLPGNLVYDIWYQDWSGKVGDKMCPLSYVSPRWA